MSDNNYDCILIPGGGLLEDGSLPEWTLARLVEAIHYQHVTEWIITLSGGTVHKPPPLDNDGFPSYESRKAAEYLIASGIAPTRILTEISSFDTIGNAYFSRLLFTEPMSLTRCLVITSEFHMPRTEAIFRWVYSLEPTDKETILSFKSTPDIGLSPSALTARQKREKHGLDDLHNKVEKIHTLTSFQRWLYTEHNAYSARGETEHLTKDELASY